MACRACEACDIDFPLDKVNCPLCTGPCTYTATRSPQADWEAVVRRERIIRTDRTMGRLPGVHMDRIVKFQGETYITDESLNFCGYPYPQVGDIIRVQGKVGDIFFELDGRAVQKGIEVGHPRYIAGWWIHRVPDLKVPDTIPDGE